MLSDSSGIPDDDDEELLLLFDQLVKEAEQENAAKRESQAKTQFFQNRSSLLPGENSSLISLRPLPLPPSPKPPLRFDAKEAANTKSRPHVFLKSSQSLGVQNPVQSGLPYTGTPNSKALVTHGAGGVWDASALDTQNDGGQNFEQILSEKNGAISLLRARLQKAESELYELRKGTGTHNLSQQAPLNQQRELKRLASELAFKDQEVLEAKRARDEKDDHLKLALDTAALLKEELESLKRVMQTDTSRSQRSQEAAEPEVAVNEVSFVQPVGFHCRDDNGECQNQVQDGNGTHPQNQAIQIEFDQEAVSPPWYEDKPSTVVPPDKLILKASDAVPLRAPASTDGYGAFCEKDRAGSEGPQESEFPNREPGTAMNENPHSGMQTVRPGSFLGFRNASGMGEPAHTLQQIWFSKGTRNDSISLMSAIFADCRQDFYTLLSTHERCPKEPSSINGLCANSSCSNHKAAFKQKEAPNAQSNKEAGEAIAFKFHNAVANVMNKLAVAATLIGPLLEYCKFQNVDIVRSALHVLRCVLRQDSAARQKLLERDRVVDTGFRLQLGKASFANLPKTEVKFEGNGWFIPNTPFHGKEKASAPIFSCPRILCHPVTLPKDISIDVLSPGHAEQQKDTAEVKGNMGERDWSLSPFTEWLLDIAMGSLSLGVKFEATAIIGLLVVHSEPLVERVQFGALLWEGGVASLLTERVGVGVQLQAVCLVHLLLYCPLILQTFCSAKDETFSVGDNLTCKLNPNFGVDEGKAMRKLTVEKCCEDAWKLGRIRRQVLQGLVACLHYSGNSLQDYALRRNVVRVLAFLAATGDTGTAILMEDYSNQTELDTPGVPQDKYQTGDGMANPQSEILFDDSGRLQARGGNCETRVPGTLSCGDGTDVVTIPKARQGMVVKERENHCNVPEGLVRLLGMELNAEDDDQKTGEGERAGCAEERECLLQEVLTLLCTLLSNSLHSSKVLNLLTVNEESIRLSFTVMNRLISRGQKRSLDMVELAMDLRKYFSAGLQEFQENGN
ncbi:hypothetical protein BDL97_12G077700 [Sphagnum fallax]|nr:hypothetical protein BDL97_12G077700 [Sphagnum fallax]